MIASGTSEVPVPTTCAVTGVTAGNYTVTVVGTGGTGIQTANRAVSFAAFAVLPDFTMSPSTTIQVVSLGRSATISVVVARPTGPLGLNSSINLIASFPPLVTSLTAAISPGVAMINSTYPNATAIVTITTTGSTPTGTYYLTVRASASTPPTVHEVTITIVVTTTTSPHDLEIYSVAPSTLSATVGSSLNISITIMNIGKLPENVTVVALVDDLSVGNQTIMNFAAGANETVTIPWNTSQFNAGTYTIGGQVLGVPGQTDFKQSILRYSTPVTLTTANNSVLQSGYIEPAIIIALVALLAVILVLMFRSRRKKPGQ
jgi:hypothetical protein